MISMKPARTPRLVGVVHLPPLPGSPRGPRDGRAAMNELITAVQDDAHALGDAGFEAVILENFGDAPFMPGAVEPITIATMAVLARAAQQAAPALQLGVNVLRNDASAATAIAIAAGASFVRINVHVGAAVTDQGIIEGSAHRTARERRAWGGEGVALWTDVDVKHARPLGARPLDEVTHDLVGRGLSDAVLVTGVATGASVDGETLQTVARAAGSTPVYVASGAVAADLERLASLGAHGVIVGSTLRADGRAGGPIDRGAADRFARAFRGAFR
jgi:membrane complex biogenesis BtpA family protein